MRGYESARTTQYVNKCSRAVPDPLRHTLLFSATRRQLPSLPLPQFAKALEFESLLTTTGAASPDFDMLQVGRVVHSYSAGDTPSETRLTRDEQTTAMTLFCATGSVAARVLLAWVRGWWRWARRRLQCNDADDAHTLKRRRRAPVPAR